MQLDEDTQEYYLADPEGETSVAEMEDKAIDMHDKLNHKPVAPVLAAMHRSGAGSVLTQYAALKAGQTYAWEMVVKD